MNFIQESELFSFEVNRAQVSMCTIKVTNVSKTVALSLTRCQISLVNAMTARMGQITAECSLIMTKTVTATGRQNRQTDCLGQTVDWQNRQADCLWQTTGSKLRMSSRTCSYCDAV